MIKGGTKFLIQYPIKSDEYLRNIDEGKKRKKRRSMSEKVAFMTNYSPV